MMKHLKLLCYVFAISQTLANATYANDDVVDDIINATTGEAEDKLVSSDIDSILTIIDAYPSQGSFQVNAGINNIIDDQIVKFDTITFQEDAILTIERRDYDFYIFAAEEVLFDSPQFNVRIQWSEPPFPKNNGINGLDYGGGSKNAGCCRKGSKKHGRHGLDGGDGTEGEDGTARFDIPVYFVVGSMKTRPGTIDIPALDAVLNFSGADGQRGGNGGRGGAGQDGGRGKKSSGFPRCRRGAGDGGNAGSGGDGKNGGDASAGANGSDIVFYGPESTLDIIKFFEIINLGGAGASGGEGGSEGRAGFVGRSGKNNRPGCGSGSFGAKGNDGLSGLDGEDSIGGKRGSLFFIQDTDRQTGTLFD